MLRTFSTADFVIAASLVQLDEALHRLLELPHLLLCLRAVFEGLANAVVHVVLQYQRGHPLGGRYVAAYLREHVHAVGLILDHPLHPAHLALYAPEAVLELLLVALSYVAVCPPPLPGHA